MESFFTILALKRVYEVHSISINLRKHSTNKSFLSFVLKKNAVTLNKTIIGQGDDARMGSLVGPVLVDVIKSLFLNKLMINVLLSLC